MTAHIALEGLLERLRDDDLTIFLRLQKLELPFETRDQKKFKLHSFKSIHNFPRDENNLTSFIRLVNTFTTNHFFTGRVMTVAARLGSRYCRATRWMSWAVTASICRS